MIIATGPFTAPRIPHLSKYLPPDIVQAHASAYRNARQFPEGSVLVVGAGASGCQIAEDLQEQGREVYFSISRHRRSLRRYRGKDLFWWLEKLGTMDTTRAQLLARDFKAPIVLTGAGGGRNIDVRAFPNRGIRILGYLVAIDGTRISFNRDVDACLRQADDAINQFVAAADAYVDRNGLALQEDDCSSFFLPASRLETPAELDVRDAGISTVVWASGYANDYAWLKLPVLDARGGPVQERGVTACPGAYFLGLKWMHKFKSSFLCGVGEDAAYVADQIDRKR